MKRIVFCTGKVYYELTKERKTHGMEDTVAIARVEQVHTHTHCVDMCVYTHTFCGHVYTVHARTDLNSHHTHIYAHTLLHSDATHIQMCIHFMDIMDVTHVLCIPT